MQQQEFIVFLAAEGFAASVIVERDPLSTFEEHRHPSTKIKTYRLALSQAD